MTPFNTPESNDQKGFFLPSLLAGISGALALIAAFYTNQWVWKPLVTFNGWLLMIQIPQMLLVGLLILVLTGAWMVSFIRPDMPTTREVVKWGILTGCIAGALVAAYIITSSSLTGNVPLPELFRWFALMMVICSVGSVAGAYGYFRVLHASKEREAQGMKKHQFRFTLTALVVCIILAMTVPPVFALAGTMTGIIGNDCTECRLHQDVQVERVSDQSIKITYTSKVPAIPWVGHYNPAVIKINGNDVSDQFRIKQQGIFCRIEPVEGLSYKNSSTVIISGQEVFVNPASPTRLVITSYNGSPHPVILFDGEI
ncbi:MAG: hypothetical protein Q7T80_00040 [Methanoregula sp.]|nr:hypothetical protein [Methanoregula sp.]